MKKIFFLGCAALALTFASCNSNKSAEQQANDAADKATEQAAAVKEEVKEEVKAVVNEALAALQTKLADFKAKVEGASKADAQALIAEAQTIKSEIDAASLTDEEKAGLVETFNSIIEICKNLK